MLQNKLCRYFILWDFFSQEFIFMEGVKKKKKKKKKIVRIYCRRGYLSRTNFYKFCLASAKAQKSHPAKIYSIKVHKFTREKQVLYEREQFSGKAIWLLLSM